MNEPIDRYLDSIFARYELAVRDEITTFATPEIDGERDDRRLDCMIETLVAFAIGHCVGRVVEAMRRIDGTLAAPIARAIAQVETPATRRCLLPPPTIASDATRPRLVDHLAAQLQQRLRLAARHARILLRAVAAAVPAHGPALRCALELLAADPAAAFAFGDQLGLGWRFFVALLTNGADPVIPDEPRWQRGRALWTAWSCRVRGIRRAAKPPQREYILQVA